MTDLWALPFRAKDFPDSADADKLIWARKKHSDSGVQEFGYDIGGVQWRPATSDWSENPSGGPANSDWVLYGTEIHAMQDGTIIAGWRNAPENEPGKLHDEITKHPGDQSRIYGGGNGMWILHADGTLAEYAHMQPGSVPEELVPHHDELLPQLAPSTNVGDCWKQIVIPEGQRKTVKKGDYLGLVGNAGTSSNPHLHIHREQGAVWDLASKTGGQGVEIEFESGWSSPKNSPDTIQWTSFAGQPIPPGPVLFIPQRLLSRTRIKLPKLVRRPLFKKDILKGQVQTPVTGR